MVASKVERAIHIGGALVTLIAGLYGGYQWGFGSGGTTVAAQGITNLERLGVGRCRRARQQLDDGNPVAAINSATEIIIGKNLPVVHSGLFVLEEREVVDVLPNVPMSFYLGSNMGSYIPHFPEHRGRQDRPEARRIRPDQGFGLPVSIISTVSVSMAAGACSSGKRVNGPCLLTAEHNRNISIVDRRRTRSAGRCGATGIGA